MRNWLIGFMSAAAVLLGSVQTGLAASIVAKVNIAEQTMTVTKHGRVIHTWKVSTARSGYITPPGEFRPYRMHRMWHSRKYDMSPMPYSIFYHGGYAIHGTNAVSRLGRPASHGCVRLHTDNARRLFALVRQAGPGNTRIIVEN
ncbi:L,D-transpeptidase [Nitratireductor mangrovi]|uniref:L,D-transpeptidase n=1 Tax=Nitratireductor mangrovi TaxID=2599600 RepID=A0A5B8L4R6_9HYPH|nr:L,D-transpeptidase [Nitratireductor mangrovi]QDZ02897.1 L,D-transpeptidase [Nitratireductor mangrovi]